MTTLSKRLTETVCVTRWHFYVLLGGSGFAIGSILAKTVRAFGG